MQVSRMCEEGKLLEVVCISVILVLGKKQPTSANHLKTLREKTTYAWLAQK